MAETRNGGQVTESALHRAGFRRSVLDREMVPVGRASEPQIIDGQEPEGGNRLAIRLRQQRVLVFVLYRRKPSQTAQYFNRQIEPGSYNISTFVEDTDYKREPIWKIASDAGRRVAVIDMVRGPLTPEINGIQVVDWLAHGITGVPRSTPQDLVSEITGKYGSDPNERPCRR